MSWLLPCDISYWLNRRSASRRSSLISTLYTRNDQRLDFPLETVMGAHCSCESSSQEQYCIVWLLQAEVESELRRERRRQGELKASSEHSRMEGWAICTAPFRVPSCGPFWGWLLICFRNARVPYARRMSIMECTKVVRFELVLLDLLVGALWTKGISGWAPVSVWAVFGGGWFCFGEVAIRLEGKCVVKVKQECGNMNRVSRL